MRLTTHDKGRQPYVITANERTWREIYDKLAAYEDTGVEPEEIEDRQDVCLWIPEDRFAEIINAEAQGRLVILPCKVGDTAYVIWTSSIYPENPPAVREDHITQVKFTKKGYAFKTWRGWYHKSDIGKTVFLSRAEAEAALKGESADV